jgi:phenylalanyl-tRNA synthetase beta subunit
VISGVNAKAATPAWMVQRLQRCGLRSISALVDVTNMCCWNWAAACVRSEQTERRH